MRTTSDRSKSVPNRCIIEVIGGSCVVTSFYYQDSVGLGAFFI